MQRLSERIWSVGVNDTDKTLFEGLWPLPYGVSYNSYVVAGEKVALIDTVESGFEEEFLSNVREAVGQRPLDYLVVNHLEPDHSSLIPFMLQEYPQMQIVANSRALPMLKGYYGVQEDRVLVVKEGDTLDLGGSTLSFHFMPMVHWPEVMATYLAEEGTLFSADAFGTFGTVPDDIVDTEDTFEQYRDEMIRYYSNIVGKYGSPVQAALKKLSPFDIKRICSTHGPVWENHIADVVSLYDRMSRYETERGVCIVYGSMYGNTAAAADALAMELEARGVPCSVHDLACNNAGELGVSGALRDVFKYDTVVVGSPTYNGGIFPPVETFMSALKERGVRNRRFLAFGSYTWASSSVRLLNALAEEMGFELLGDGIPFPHAFTREKFDTSSIADRLS